MVLARISFNLDNNHHHPTMLLLLPALDCRSASRCRCSRVNGGAVFVWYLVCNCAVEAVVMMMMMIVVKGECERDAWNW